MKALRSKPNDNQAPNTSTRNILSPSRPPVTITSQHRAFRAGFTLLSITLIIATSALKADECADILRAGIHDELDLKKSSESVSTFKSLLDMDLTQLERTSKQGGKEGRVAFSIMEFLKVDAGGSGSNKEQKLRQLRQSFHSNHENFFKSSEFVDVSRRTVNKSIVDAWLTCMTNQTRFVTGWYADDTLYHGRVTVMFTKRGPEGRAKAVITAVTTNNLILVPEEKARWFSRELAPAIRTGKPVRLGESVSSVFQRINPDKPASIVVAFGTYGSVELRFPARNPPPTNVVEIKPREFVVSALVEKVGARRISGGDREMDTDPGDVVTCTFSSELEHDTEKVWISADYTCEEYQGNHTKLGVDLNDKVLYSAPAGMKIVGLEHAGDSAFSKNPRIRGRNHGFVEIKLPKDTYWKSLDCRVDSSADNDAPKVGFKGVVGFTVKLQNR